MALEAISGKNGTVKMADSGSATAEVAEVRSFTINRVADVPKYASSSTGGFKKTGEAIRDWNASVEIYLQDGDFDAGYDEGDLVDCEFLSTTGKTFSGTARISEIGGVNVDIEGGGFVNASLKLEGHGAYTVASV